MGKLDVHIRTYNRVEDKYKHVNRELKHSRIMCIWLQTAKRESGGLMIDCNLFLSLNSLYQSEFSAEKRNCWECFQQKGT